MKESLIFRCCSRIAEGLDLTLARIRQAAPPFIDAYKKIAIVTDNDDANTVNEVIRTLNTVLANHGVILNEVLAQRKWIGCSVGTSVGIPFEFELLLLVIPFSHNGAMETFLLDALAAADPYDAGIIQRCRTFVANADPEPRYLTARGDRTKAEFAAYFCIRTAPEAYAERRTILKTGVNWASYITVQNDFAELARL